MRRAMGKITSPLHSVFHSPSTFCVLCTSCRKKISAFCFLSQLKTCFLLIVLFKPLTFKDNSRKLKLSELIQMFN